ncbi:sirohydrochlorin cobaltochelatase [Desulfovibrio ferrophilus]|uniref:Anaerobic cobalt chelatase n=1 Tax=Desulfovibrio ferrophilus TaxID=241368 RepID=A0A2Z6AX22_9BACT|nr:sirohydrochlorin cobaltochelatase [Desulfovibrio ferrophilus]BBD07748.1 anaerobic cobalt chelatase [Desulfovibrio ferrophilus]
MRFVHGRRTPRTLCLVLLLLLFSSVAYAGHGEASAAKKGILLVAFGTSEPAAQVSFTHLGEEVGKRLPGTPVRWAYTSNIIRRKLAKQGQVYDSVPIALSKMIDEGFTHIAVQSLHTIPGEEFHEKLLRVVKGFRSMAQISVGAPLMATPQDMEAVVKAIKATIPADRKASEAVVLMGHGTHHPGNIYYPGLQWYLSKAAPLVYVGTVEGTPSLDDVLAGLKANKVKKVWLMPFMSVAGDHARNDMAGPEDDSWISILTAKGYKTEAVLKGTAEYDVYSTIWIDHLQSAFERLN